MKESQGMQAQRAEHAESLAKSREATETMTIQCSHGHHLGRIVDTPDGLIIETHLNRRSHGRRDLHSDAHGVDGPTLWHDFVSPDGDPAVDDAIPAGCACGDRLLSRAAIIEWIHDGDPRPIVH